MFNFAYISVNFTLTKLTKLGIQSKSNRVCKNFSIRNFRRFKGTTSSQRRRFARKWYQWSLAMAGVALGVIGVRLVWPFPHPNGNRRNPPKLI
jgi:hypothetical protein